MKLKFGPLFRIYLGLCVAILLWSAWMAAAQGDRAVRLIEPEDGTRFDPKSSIALRAVVSPSAGALKSVEFLRNGQVLGVSSNEPYSFTWTNATAGTYTLAARAIPVEGAAIESEAIHIRVYNALVTFGLDRIAVLENYKPLGIPLWQYCASLIYIFLAFYVSKVLDYLTRVWLKRWADKTQTRFDDLLLNLLNGPIKIIAFVLLLRIGLEVFSWPALVQTVLTKGFAIIVAVSLTYMLLKFIDLVVGFWKSRTRGEETDAAFDAMLFPIIRKSLKLFIVAVAALVTLDNIGVNITAAIASLSIGGLAVGLAAQDTLANLFGAVSVFVDKPFRIGDRIQIENVDGTVEAIGMRSTRVRNLDGHLITVPNKTMGNATITNITRRPNIKTVMNIGITYDTPGEKVRNALALLREIYQGHAKTADLLVGFNQFADSALNIQVIHWWNGTDYKEYLAGMEQLNLTIKDRFDAEGISFAFPSQTVYLKQDSEWRLSQSASSSGEPR